MSTAIFPLARSEGFPAAPTARRTHPFMETALQSKSILDRIIDLRRDSVERRKRVLPEVALKIAVEKKAPAPRDFSGALSRNRINIVAELKKASPSLGPIRKSYDPEKLAAGLESAGAAALSVLTEEDFFQGSLAHLKSVVRAVNLPILRKDFVFDPWQVWETRASGADSFLLIVAVLSDSILRELLDLGHSLQMEPLVEVHSAAELARAADCGARIIGVNNRDLRNFQVRLETSLELIDAISDDCIAVSESGLHTPSDLSRLRAAGFDAFLIGEHLMKRDDPAQALRELLPSSGAIGAVSEG